MWLRAFLSCIAFLTVVSVADPRFEFSLRKADDSITAVKDGDQTAFVIVCKSGIGDGTVKLKEGQWPQKIVLRFQYNPTEAFKGLEGFNLTTARIRVEGAEKQSKEMRFFLAGADGKFPDEPAGTLNIAVKEGKNALEVTLPANLLMGASQVEFSWIDFYRR